MSKKRIQLLAGITAVAVLVSGFGLPGAESVAAENDDLQYSVSRGGRLYDNWYGESRDRPPEKSHPAYPADKTYAEDPSANWRCKECHGWDYKGVDGTYGSGRHFTGIKGIRGMVGAAPEKIIAVLKDATHVYGGLMTEEDFRDLANFVSRGQVDMDNHIDAKTKQAKGNPVQRRDHYRSICSGCHGMDGFRLKSIPPLGDVARGNPWESLHMILNGHPREKMPSLRAFERQVLVDILAYVQTLPSGAEMASLVRGGRLYDNWRRESGVYLLASNNLVHAINRRHPAYPLDKKFARNPEVNWRCKECHGWDYKGVDGAYGSGRHFTGIKGIRDMIGKPSDKIVAILKDANHQYGKILEYRDLEDLANFVSRGQVDMDLYINQATLQVKGSPASSKAYYTTICATCHGLRGTDVVTAIPLGRLARNNPWEAFHKIINGHPDESMPALRVLGEDKLADILSYLRTLPTKR